MEGCKLRKAYSKPEIMFEDFTLSTNIAGNCGAIVGSPSQGTCGIPDNDGDSFFTVGVIEGCTIGGDEDGFCYDNPSNDGRLFNS